MSATEEKVKHEAAGCRILQMATHAIVSDASPMYSQLVMARPESGTSEDGLLETWEIMNLDLNADLVTGLVILGHDNGFLFGLGLPEFQ